ncbi:uncharacterized protein G2W53_028900 [Senna tora]|uniref:Uncharacterized protein n=1 Tax=Senna tora TaxID=362788 RepID=A0A834T4C9_9FABA|nr:uncharacterized protein G2W53_028900 [Senna tora]
MASNLQVQAKEGKCGCQARTKCTKGAKLVIQKAELMVLRELELSWSQPELIWNLWIEEKLTL